MRRIPRAGRHIRHVPPKCRPTSRRKLIAADDVMTRLRAITEQRELAEVLFLTGELEASLLVAETTQARINEMVQDLLDGLGAV